MLCSIVITYNAEKWIEKCFGSLVQQRFRNHKVIAIDNASADNTVNVLKDTYPEVEVVELAQNLGFGKANNIGISKAINYGADFIFLLNQDAWVLEGLENAIEVMQSNIGYGIISPLHYAGSGDVLDRNFCKYLEESNILPDKLFQSTYTNQIHDAKFINAAAWLISTVAIKKIGGFDPLFSHYGEDRNYCCRLNYLGLKLGILSGFKIIHDRNQLPDSRYFTELERLYINQLVFLLDPLTKRKRFTWYLYQLCRSLMRFNRIKIKLRLKTLRNMRKINMHRLAYNNSPFLRYNL